jgi:hypothetical protein
MSVVRRAAIVFTRFSRTSYKGRLFILGRKKVLISSVGVLPTDFSLIYYILDAQPSSASILPLQRTEGLLHQSQNLRHKENSLSHHLSNHGLL